MGKNVRFLISWIFSIILSALKIVQHFQTKPAILASLKFETKPNSKNLEELGYIHFSYFDILKPSYRQISIEDKVIFYDDSFLEKSQGTKKILPKSARIFNFLPLTLT